MLLIACLALFLLAVALNHASKRRMRESVSNLKGPYCFPLFGSVYKLFRLNPKSTYSWSAIENCVANSVMPCVDMLQRGQEMRQQYGNVLRGWAFNRLVVMSADVELNEQLLSSQLHIMKQRSYRMLCPWLGEGLLLSDGKKWHARRKIITPTFHFKILEQFVEVFDQQSSIFVRRLAQRADGADGCSAFDIYPYVCAAALDIIAETAMGTKVHAQTDSVTEYAAAVQATTKLMAWRFLRVPLNIELIFAILCPHLKWRQTRLIRIMHDFTRNVIEQRRESLQSTFEQQPFAPVVDDVGSKKRLALLDVLLQSTIDGKPLSNEDIREEVDTFMFEGHDTTTSAISFALHLIARHPEVQAKLLAEAQHVLGEDRNAAVTMRHLNELKYMECVIKESLRLYPSVPIIGRQLFEDFKYMHSKLGVGILPAGTELFIPIFLIMRDAENFGKPDDFLPERHENGQNIGAFALIPFSAGPRNCIGQKFAMLEIKIMLAKMVRAYELLPLGEAVSPEMTIVLRSSNGFQLGLRKRV